MKNKKKNKKKAKTKRGGGGQNAGADGQPGGGSPVRDKRDGFHFMFYDDMEDGSDDGIDLDNVDESLEQHMRNLDESFGQQIAHECEEEGRIASYYLEKENEVKSVANSPNLSLTEKVKYLYERCLQLVYDNEKLRTDMMLVTRKCERMENEFHQSVYELVRTTTVRSKLEAQLERLYTHVSNSTDFSKSKPPEPADSDSAAAYERDFCIHVAVCLDDSWYNDEEKEKEDKEKKNNEGEKEKEGGEKDAGGEKKQQNQGNNQKKGQQQQQQQQPKKGKGKGKGGKGNNTNNQQQQQQQEKDKTSKSEKNSGESTALEPYLPKKDVSGDALSSSHEILPHEKIAAEIVQKGCESYGVSMASFLAILRSSSTTQTHEKLPYDLELKLLRERLDLVLRQFRIRERHFGAQLKSKDIERQMCFAKLKRQSKLTNKEMLQAKLCREEVERLMRAESDLREQLSLYAEKFEQFQDTLTKSNDVFATFKQEMERMTKNIKKLEKDNIMLRKKSEQTDVTLIDMAEERNNLRRQVELLRARNSKVEGLCRALQSKRKYPQQPQQQPHEQHEQQPSPQPQTEMEEGDSVDDLTLPPPATQTTHHFGESN